MATKLIEQIAKTAQNCVQQNPVIVLGSGASASYGLRGMGPLAKHLIDTVDASIGEEEDAWLLVRTALSQDEGLEEALLNNSVPASLLAKIINRTWEAIAADDLNLLYRASRRETEFALSRLLQGLFRSTQKVISIVTTNYDRVAEYSVDLAGYMHETGFSPGLIRSRQQSAFVPFLGNQEIRRVRIWKVHGSLDWFSDKEDVPICLPLTPTVPEGFSPLIVTPGTSKYERTHDEPFRSAIRGADAAIGGANAILCVGYGFRDRHIQPKIIERCRGGNVPIIVLARTLTPEAHEFLNKSGGRSWLAMQMHEGNTRVFSPEHPDGADLDGDTWSFDGFNRLVF
ncbi:SIR2 family protein [Rhizobium sp.]|jgi:hypothetical protein|uniref:SIR2 family protein n=1 Tax=Rhizobium sp. TaxID=391 RepID=UPI000E9BDDE2|nr:SIR2 family protein [Rhizobium sp.]